MKYLVALLSIFALSNVVISRGITCNRAQCFQSNQCPSAPEMEESMESETTECRVCVTNVCGPYDANNASLVEECLTEARAECMSCSDEDRMQMKNCMTCYRICRVRGTQPPPRDRDSATRLEMFRAQRAQCESDCEGSDYCLSEEEMQARRDDRIAMCRSCVRDLCGEFTPEDLSPENDINSTLRMCVFRAQIGNCRTPCLTGDSEYQENKRNCSMCVIDCVRQAQKSPCLRMCEMEGGCPTDDERRMENQERVATCKSCVREICGAFNYSDFLSRPELRTCVSDAQSNNCTESCSRNYQSAFEEDCMTCVEECEAMVPDVAGEIEEEMEEQITATFEGTADFDIEN